MNWRKTEYEDYTPWIQLYYISVCYIDHLNSIHCAICCDCERDNNIFRQQDETRDWFQYDHFTEHQITETSQKAQFSANALAWPLNSQRLWEKQLASLQWVFSNTIFCKYHAHSCKYYAHSIFDRNSIMFIITDIWITIDPPQISLPYPLVHWLTSLLFWSSLSNRDA